VSISFDKLTDSDAYPTIVMAKQEVARIVFAEHFGQEPKLQHIIKPEPHQGGGRRGQKRRRY
jgi:hypothetical protein